MNQHFSNNHSSGAVKSTQVLEYKYVLFLSQLCGLVAQEDPFSPKTHIWQCTQTYCKYTVNTDLCLKKGIFFSLQTCSVVKLRKN